MNKTTQLLFGPLAALILAAGIIGLGFLVPGYEPIRQTVSEIGEMDSPMRIPFAVMLCTVAVCLLIFAWGVGALARVRGRSTLAAWFIAFMAIPSAGVGVFAFPHPWHGLFGLSEIIGYQAPAVFALTWRRDPEARSAVGFSWLMFLVVWISIGANLFGVARQGDLWTAMKPYYGLVQRALFASWFVWATGLGLLLRRLKG
jgi:hypothetical protein